MKRAGKPDSPRAAWEAVRLQTYSGQMKLLDLDKDTAREVVSALAMAHAPEVRSAMDMLDRRGGELLRVRDERIDGALGGGIFPGNVVEVVGEAGSGKTQLCLTLCALATLPRNEGGLGLDASVVYIDTELRFEAERVIEIAKSIAPQLYDADAVGASAEENLCQFLRRIAVVRAASQLDLFNKVATIAEEARDRNVKLLIVDSVAYLARKDFTGSRGYRNSGNGIGDRQEALMRLANLLKRIASDCNCAVIVTNQVTSQLAGRGSAGGDHLEAALGTAWHHCISTRLVLRGDGSGGDGASPCSRVLTIEKSPIAPRTAVAYEIGAAGVSFPRP